MLLKSIEKNWLLIGLVCLNGLILVNFFSSLRIHDVVDKTPMPSPSQQVASNPARWQLLSAQAVPEAQLDLKLVGVSLAQPVEQSEVLLEFPTGETQVFQLGEQLPNGAEIRRIEAESVILWLGGREQQLQLPQSELP